MKSDKFTILDKSNIMRIVFSFVFVLGLIFSSAAQEAVEWADLAGITYIKKMDELLGFKVDMPVFNDQVKKFEGKKIKIKGYIIPTEGYKNQKEFIFSAYPYSMCFFCGNAGPETVMEVRSPKGVPFTNDQITISGTLHLNGDDINSLMFLLTDAAMVK